MIKTYAILDNTNTVINIVLGENKEIVEEVTGAVAIEVDPGVTLEPTVGLGWDGVRFEQPPVTHEPVVEEDFLLPPVE